MKPWRIFLLLCLLLLSATGLFARPAKAYSPNLNFTRVGGYGPLLGYDAPALTLSGSLADSLVWRTRRVDPSGFYWMGARYYEPVSGQFLSPDPAGHGGSWDLYSFANGDPINQFDPDGRFGKQAWASGQYYGGIALGTFAGMAHDVDTMSAVGNPNHPRYLEVTAGMAGQAAIDYAYAGEGWSGSRNAFNRYNPMRAPFEAFSGMHVMEGPPRRRQRRRCRIS